MSKTITLSTLLILVTNLSYSQTGTKSIVLKVYANFSFSSEELSYEDEFLTTTATTDTGENSFRFNFSPAIAFQNTKGNAHEIAVSRLQFQNNYSPTIYVFDTNGNFTTKVSDESLRRFELCLRYEYILKVFKKKNWKTVNTSLGFSIQPFIRWHETLEVLPDEFNSDVTVIGTRFAIVPRAQYNLSDNLYVDFNLPLTANLFQGSSQKIENDSSNQPLINSAQYKQGPLGIAVRFGIGVRI